MKRLWGITAVLFISFGITSSASAANRLVIALGDSIIGGYALPEETAWNIVQHLNNPRIKILNIYTQTFESVELGINTGRPGRYGTGLVFAAAMALTNPRDQFYVVQYGFDGAPSNAFQPNEPAMNFIMESVNNVFIQHPELRLRLAAVLVSLGSNDFTFQQAGLEGRLSSIFEYLRLQWGSNFKIALFEMNRTMPDANTTLSTYLADQAQAAATNRNVELISSQNISYWPIPGTQASSPHPDTNGVLYQGWLSALQLGFL